MKLYKEPYLFARFDYRAHYLLKAIKGRVDVDLGTEDTMGEFNGLVQRMLDIITDCETVIMWHCEFNFYLTDNWDRLWVFNYSYQFGEVSTCYISRGKHKTASTWFKYGSRADLRHYTYKATRLLMPAKKRGYVVCQ